LNPWNWNASWLWEAAGHGGGKACSSGPARATCAPPSEVMRLNLRLSGLSEGYEAQVNLLWTPHNLWPDAGGTGAGGARVPLEKDDLIPLWGLNIAAPQHPRHVSRRPRPQQAHRRGANLEGFVPEALGVNFRIVSQHSAPPSVWYVLYLRRWTVLAASERKGNSLRSCKDFCVEVKAMSCMCYVRSASGWVLRMGFYASF
jgi:hypothetical protein